MQPEIKRPITRHWDAVKQGVWLLLVYHGGQKTTQHLCDIKGKLSLHEILYPAKIFFNMHTKKRHSWSERGSEKHHHVRWDVRSESYWNWQLRPQRNKRTCVCRLSGAQSAVESSWWGRKSWWNCPSLSAHCYQHSPTLWKVTNTSVRAVGMALHSSAGRTAPFQGRKCLSLTRGCSTPLDVIVSRAEDPTLWLAFLMGHYPGLRALNQQCILVISVGLPDVAVILIRVS
jgi:hypothetical protein